MYTPPQPGTPLRASVPSSLPYNHSTPPPPPPKPVTHFGQGSPATGPRPPPIPPQPQYETYDERVPRGHERVPPYGASPIQNVGGYTIGQQQQGSTGHVENTDLPPPGWLPQCLVDKSKSDLESLFHDSAAMTALLHNRTTAHSSLTSSTDLLESHLSANVSLAQHLKTLQSQLEQTRSHVSSHLLSVRALESRWRKSQSQLEARLEPWGPRELHQRLVASITDQENLCKGVEESFIDDDTGAMGTDREIGEWVKRAREGRKLLHLRQERRGRWDEGRVGGWR